MAGGVALNCVMNARLRDRGPFKRHLGAARRRRRRHGPRGRALDRRPERGATARRYAMDHAFLGPAYGDDEIEAFLRWSKLPYRRLDDVAEETAELLAQDKVIGWFQGRMEFGPRALGARSILASPIHAEMQARLNEIKDREDFRPVAPVVLEEEAADWFVGRRRLAVHAVRPRRAAREGRPHPGRPPRRRHGPHPDDQPRAQNPALLRPAPGFHGGPGVPVLVNTSFNTRGEPIVCTPRDAVECFWTSPLDALVIGSFLLEKPGARP